MLNDKMLCKNTGDSNNRSEGDCASDEGAKQASTSVWPNHKTSRHGQKILLGTINRDRREENQVRRKYKILHIW